MIELGIDRLFRLYGIFLVLGLVFIFFGIDIRRREGEKTRQRVFLSKFFLISALGLIINVIYAPFDSVEIQTLGNKFVILTQIMGLVNLCFFTISLHKSEKEFTPKKSRILEIGLLLLALITYFLPNIFTIEFTEDYAPIWSMAMGLYVIIIFQAIFILIMIFGILSAKIFEDKQIKKRLQYLLIGIIFLQGVVFSTFLRNLWINRSIWTLLLGLSIIPSGLFLYFGVGKKL